MSEICIPPWCTDVRIILYKFIHYLQQKCVWKILFTFFGFPHDLPPDGATTSQKRFGNIFLHHGFSLRRTNVFVAVCRQFNLLRDVLCGYAYCSCNYYYNVWYNNLSILGKWCYHQRAQSVRLENVFETVSPALCALHNGSWRTATVWCILIIKDGATGAVYKIKQ